MNRIVLFLTDSLSLGGAERQLHLLTISLPQSWKPILIALSSGPMLEWYKKDNIQVITIQRKYRFDGLSPFLKIRKLINAFQPSIVHSWGWMSTIASSISLIGTEIPHISSVIRMGELPNRRRYISRFSSIMSNLTIANSEAGLKSWNISSMRGRVVHNGFDWKRLQDHERVIKKKTGSFSIIMIASMSELKDWGKFIDTAKYITNNHYDQRIEFIGYGDGYLRDDLLKDAENLVSIGRMELPGRIADPITACFKANVGVLLSTYGEGISNSIMEYMACGLPVICTRSGGNPELVIDGTTGFLVEPDNPKKQIAEKILWLRDNPDKAIEMGEAGKKRIASEFSLEKMVCNYLNLYEELIVDTTRRRIAE